jgi:hypothetical protein
VVHGEKFEYLNVWEQKSAFKQHVDFFRVEFNLLKKFLKIIELNFGKILKEFSSDLKATKKEIGDKSKRSPSKGGHGVSAHGRTSPLRVADRRRSFRFSFAAAIFIHSCSFLFPNEIHV